MTEQEFKDRTKRIALRIIRLVSSLPRGPIGDAIGRQLLRAGTGIGSNYRAACRGVSRADVISKLGDVEEEADESLYRLEPLVDSGLVPQSRLRDLMAEVGAVLAMTVASIKTLRLRNPKSKIQNRKSRIGAPNP
jgi:four helix bundle protein